jgi:hypothetical protein
MIGENGIAFQQELGFRRESVARYAKAGAAIDLDAMQFADATSAFSFFPDPITGPGSFRSSDTVVLLLHENGKPAHLKEDLQELAKGLPVATGGKALLPSLPDYLPKEGLDRSSLVYAFGPEVWHLNASPAQTPLADALDFSTGAEAVAAKYKGGGTLTLVNYPTPQMAQAQWKSFAALFHLAPQKNLPEGLQSGTGTLKSSSGTSAIPVTAWRSGPIVAFASSMTAQQALSLADKIHYEAEITENKPQGYVSEAWRAAHLYLGIAALSGILCGSAIFLGLFFGGARAIIRVLQGKSASSVEDTEFISLHLAPGPVQTDAKPD